ncbi:Nitronate monooxygenase [compost metagenome]
MQASERDTNLIFRTLHNTARVLKNAVSDEVVSIERRPGGAQFEDVKHLVAGVRGKAALKAGETDGGIISAGQCVGLIDDVPSCEELITRMVADCREHLSVASRFFA